MGLEHEVHEEMRRANSNEQSARKLCFNSNTRRLELTDCNNDPDKVKPLINQDMNLYCESVIVLDGTVVQRTVEANECSTLGFQAKDDATVFTTLSGIPSQSVSGSINVSFDHANDDVTSVGFPEDRVRVLVDPETINRQCKDNNRSQPITGYVKKKNVWVQATVMISPVTNELFSRFRGIFETDIISDGRVCIVGLGSGGSAIGSGLAKSGVQNFVFIDYDRLEVGNILRHEAGISDVGRLKVNAVKDIILDNNPFANIDIICEKITWDSIEKIRNKIKQCDIVIAAVDNRQAKMVLNRLCLEEDKTMLVAGAFRRAYGGQVLRIRPHQSPCFNCFIDSLPEEAKNNEISSIEQAEGLAYTDRPVPIEPGLANDIMPINQMVVKLAIQELLKGKDTTLKSLNEDLNMPLYLWLNRREQQTCYEDLQPMEDVVSEMTVMRWYGIDLPRNTACPECGYFDAAIQNHGIQVDLSQ